MPESVLKAVKYQNHILIGLGGTGGAALREFRKEMFRRHGPALPEGLRIEYLYVDSSEADLNNESDWKVFGETVQLPQGSRLNIRVPDLTSIVENAPAYPGIATWLGPRTLWTEYLSSLQGLQAAGGQRRRLGRLLFAHTVSQFNRAIATKYNAIVSGLDQGAAGTSGVTFHLLCGLAGGTGSGSVVDAAVQIGHFIAERGKQTVDRVLIYAYLPETSPPPEKAERYYVANGYAALLELNAVSAGRLLPFDLAGTRPFRVGEFMPFNGCYVFTNETESGSTYHPNDAPGLLSGFLYQKIVAVRDAGAWPTLVRAENSENGLPDSEPRVGPDGQKPQPERSVRFMTFGIKRLAIPEAEIQEYLTYNYAREALRQLRYNHWSPQFGYIDNVKNNDFAEYRTDEKLAAFRCSWDHLILSRPILDADLKKQWQEIDEYWLNFLDHSKEEILASVDKKLWLNETRVRAVEQLQQEYRGDGVSQFYQQKSGTVAVEAREISQLIETFLLTEFLGGRLSLAEVTGQKSEDRSFKGIIEVIKDELTSRTAKAREALEKSRNHATEIEEILAEIEMEYSKLWIIDPFNRRSKLMEEHEQALTDYLAAKVRAQGYEYAVKLCPMVVSQLEQMYDQATLLFAVMNNLFQQFEASIKTRCTEGEKPDYGRPFIKFYNAHVVRNYVGRARIDETLMRQQCGNVRQALTAHLGFEKESPTLKEFNFRLPAVSLAAVMERACSHQSRTDHDALIQKNEDRLFGVDLVSRLLQEFRTSDQLGDFAKRLIPQATTLAALDETERGNVTANSAPESIVRRSISVICKGVLETLDHPRPEIRPLVNSLRAAPPPGSGEVQLVDAPGQPSEMVVVSLANLLPLRCIKRVAFLRSRYEHLLTGAGASKSDAMFLHLEGDGTQYPSLFAMSMNQVRELARRLVLLAVSTGVVREAADSFTGRQSLLYEEKDDHGIIVDTVQLGSDVPAAVEAITPEIYHRLMPAVDAAIKTSNREALKKKVAEAMRLLQSRTDVSPQDSAGFVAAYRQISSELN